MDSTAALKENLPVAMLMAAFIGISWYISIELNIRLFFSFSRYRGLYFWSCLLCSWGVLVQPLAIVLTDFAIWHDHLAAIVIIYLSWLIMVIPQTFVLYSRLHLVMRNLKRLQWVLYGITTVSICFAVPTMTMGIIAQTSSGAALLPSYLIWDKLQLCIFFTQETFLSLLYIHQTHKRLKNGTMIHHDAHSYTVLRHLLWVNVLVILLDCSLLALSFSGLFYVQSAYKPCVYGIKLRIEFAVLNRLIASVQRNTDSGSGQERASSSFHYGTSRNDNIVRLESVSGQSTKSVTGILERGMTSVEFQPDLPSSRHGILQRTDIWQVYERSTLRPAEEAANCYANRSRFSDSY